MKRRQFLAAALAAAASTKLTVTLLSKDGEVQLRLLHAEVFNQYDTELGAITYAHVLVRDDNGNEEWVECATRAGEDAQRKLINGLDLYLSRRHGARYGFRNFSHCKRRTMVC